MYLLDTNVVSMLDARRHVHAPALIEWLKRNGASLFLSVMTIAEMEAGLLKLRREGKAARADEIAALLSAILSEFRDRVLHIDVETARHVARLGELTHKQSVELPDIIIGATAARHGLIVLTRNLADFGRLGVPCIDPFGDLPTDV